MSHSTKPILTADRRTFLKQTFAAGAAVSTFGLHSRSAGMISNPLLDEVRLPFVDLDQESTKQIIVDKEPGQYLGHPSTALLENGRTILCVYPKGHGNGAIVYKRSEDGGLTWSDRLPTPESWQTSQEVPVLARTVGPKGQKYLLLWSGLYPARLALSKDDGRTWSELNPAGDWGGIVVMGDVVPLRTGRGHYMAMFHDDGRFFKEQGKREDPVLFTLYKTFTRDGGLTWDEPEPVYRSTEVHLCEPGIIRSPDGGRLAILLRENARRKNSHIMFSNDEGRTFTDPRQLPLALSGDRHQGVYTPDGRLFVSFRANLPNGKDSPAENDWAGWVGSWDDLVNGTEGQYYVRLKRNFRGADCAYPAVEVLPDGTIVAVTYGHWEKNAEPYILGVRFKPLPEPLQFYD